METLLLHLDEELINSRRGRRIKKKYNEHDLAFWTQFYSLFYDTVYVPANFLTDSNMTPRVLIRMGIENSQSAIRAEDGPFKILWDKSRFPEDNFHALIETFASDKPDVSMRDIRKSRYTARLCDEYLSRRIVPANMTANLDPKESVEGLFREVFNSSENTALSESKINRLSECLHKIVNRGDILEKGERFGYGRNFYYVIFGYGRTEPQQNRAKQFSDIVNEYMDLRHEFLTAVDYISHRLKAKFASDYLNKEIGVLIPQEYNQIVVPASKSIALAAGFGKVMPVEVSVSRSLFYLLDYEAVINITAKQLEDLHSSNEYKEYKIALDDLRMYQGFDEDDEASKRRKRTLEDRIEAYLEKVSKTLHPKRHTMGKALKIASEGISWGAGYTTRFLLDGLTTASGVPPVSDSGVETSAELVAKLFSKKTIDKVMHRFAREESIRQIMDQCNTIQLTEDIRIYLEDK